MRALLALALALGLAAPALAGSTATTSIVDFGQLAPAVVCNNSAVINIASATTTQLVALAAGKQIFVCGFSFTATGTAPTVQFVSGTGSACATSPTNFTGTYAPTAGTGLAAGGGFGALFRTVAGQALCVVTTGTGPSVQGIVTFTQY